MRTQTSAAALPPESGAGAPGARLLLVDDERTLLRGYARLLQSAGHSVTCAASGAEATAALQRERFDVVVTDVAMPGISGLDLLRIIRRSDLDVPVVLVTGSPTVASAAEAVEHGAFRYLTKPVAPAALEEVVGRAVRQRRLADLRRAAVPLLGNQLQVGDLAGLDAKLDLALRGLWLAFQPIVSWSEKRVIAHEALMRSSEPALPDVGAVLDAAERLNRVEEVGRRVRELAARAPAAPGLFVNLHPRDLLDDELYSRRAPLAGIAQRVVLEVTERASLDGVPDVRARIAELRRLGYRIALDDLGAGYAGLGSFAQLEPDFVKLDMGLVRELQRAPTKQKLVRSMRLLCGEMSIGVISEGIETVEERDALVGLGCDLMQGYLFAKPSAQPAEPRL